MVARSVGVLGSKLVDHRPSRAADGWPKRWVGARPPALESAAVRTAAVIGVQVAGDRFAGLVGVSLRRDDFEALLASLDAQRPNAARADPQRPVGASRNRDARTPVR
jgi:hypothetical protein